MKIFKNKKILKVASDDAKKVKKMIISLADRRTDRELT